MEKLFEAEYWTELVEKLIDWGVQVLPGLIFIVIILVVLLRLLKFLMKRLSKFTINRAKRDETKDSLEAEKRVNTLLGIIAGIGKVIIWTVALMMILKKLGIDIAPILAGAGIVGLAVGFGAQELVRDFISGFFILLENQIRTGDVAIINGTGGLVEKIEMRTVTLRDFSGVVHVFQNGKINTLSNMTKEWSAVVLDIGVAYKEKPEYVMSVMAEVGNELQNDVDFKDRFLEPMEIFGVDSLGDSAVVVRARIKTKPGEQWNVGREYRKRIKNAFDAKGIEIPFPHTTVYWGEAINPLKLKLENEKIN
ncbi:MAG: mechanosensitive ion channel family protein [Prolixibacteraceae bacterium]|nr:mechanosensitive ion channel family protein [Prolixibacteraceae bacterium]MBN2650691.1 mechanosensitive ion channel family protein [Prolixibacteraceae bacterium]